MSADFKNGVSRRALIVGMTNTDQAPTWQAGPATAEVIPDVEDRAPAAGGDVDENTGLTAEEQAMFDGMRTGDGPADPADGGGDGDDDDTAGEDPGISDGAGPLAGDPDGRTGERKPGEPAAADGKTKGPPKTVNYSKYQRELAKANERAATHEATARKEREDRIKLSARVDLINEALAAQRTAAEQAAQVDPNAPPADPFEEQDVDPAEDYAGAIAQVNRRMAFQREQSQNVQQTMQISNEDRQLKETFVRDFNVYAGTPEGKDLPAAYQFLKDSRLTEICITRFDKDPNDPNEIFTPQELQEMVNLFNQEEKWVVSNAISQNKSPAVAILKLARSRGFAKPPAAAPKPAPAAGARTAAPAAGARTAVPAVRPAAPSAADAAAALAQLRQNQEDARSLSDGGGVPPGGLTTEMLLKLDDTQFAELLDTMSEPQLQALMGREFPGGAR